MPRTPRAIASQGELFERRWLARVGPLPEGTSARRRALALFLAPADVAIIEEQRRQIHVEIEAAWAAALSKQWECALALVGLFEALGSIRQRGFWRQRAAPRQRQPGERRWKHGEYGRHLHLAVLRESMTTEDEAVLRDSKRPQTRADCLPGGCNEARPCPWLGCRYHIGVEIAPSFNPETGDPAWVRHLLEWDEDGGPSCALDVADQGARMPTEVGVILGLTKQGAVFVVKEALQSLERASADAGLEHADLLRGIDALREEAANDRERIAALHRKAGTQ